WDPGSTEGTRLLAHELTHVVQQGGARAHSPASTRGPPLTGTIGSSPESVQRQPTADVGLPSLRTVIPGALPPSLRDCASRGPVVWLREQVTGLLSGLVDRVGRSLPSGALEQLSTDFGSLAERAAVIRTALATGDCEPLFQAITSLQAFASEVA